jgi:hypothetical protein
MIIRGDYGYNKCARIYGNIKEIEIAFFDK